MKNLSFTVVHFWHVRAPMVTATLLWICQYGTWRNSIFLTFQLLPKLPLSLETVTIWTWQKKINPWCTRVMMQNNWLLCYTSHRWASRWSHWSIWQKQKWSKQWTFSAAFWVQGCMVWCILLVMASNRMAKITWYQLMLRAVIGHQRKQCVCKQFWRKWLEPMWSWTYSCWMFAAKGQTSTEWNFCWKCVIIIVCMIMSIW